MGPGRVTLPDAPKLSSTAAVLRNPKIEARGANRTGSLNPARARAATRFGHLMADRHAPSSALCASSPAGTCAHASCETSGCGAAFS